MLWHPIKKEIVDWLESKMLAFVQEESIGSQLSTKNWVDEYIYSDIHEIFFTEFPIVLHDLFSRLATCHKNFQRREAVEWSDQLVREITSVSNPIYRAVDYLVESIL